jgi:hypothetical protein
MSLGTGRVLYHLTVTDNFTRWRWLKLITNRCEETILELRWINPKVLCYDDCYVCFGHSPLPIMFFSPCTCLHSHFGIPMLPVDCHMTPAAPVCVGPMALPPLAGSAHSHRSLAPS